MRVIRGQSAVLLGGAFDGENVNVGEKETVHFKVKAQTVKMDFDETPWVFKPMKVERYERVSPRIFVHESEV